MSSVPELPYFAHGGRPYNNDNIALDGLHRSSISSESSWESQPRAFSPPFPNSNALLIHPPNNHVQPQNTIANMPYPNVPYDLHLVATYSYSHGSSSYPDPSLVSHYATGLTHGQLLGSPAWSNNYQHVPRSAVGIGYNHEQTLDSTLGRPLGLLTEGHPSFSHQPEPSYQQSPVPLHHGANMGGAQLDQGRAAHENLQAEERGHLFPPRSPEMSQMPVGPSPNDGFRQRDLNQAERNSSDGPDDNESDDAPTSNDTPYAQLIFRALLEAPDHRMVLTDIYEWFENNTDKAKGTTQKSKTGWKNSIRHNLSMNPAFCKEPLKEPFADGKRRYIWCLDQAAIEKGKVAPTTRFRKHLAGKKTVKPKAEIPSPQQQRPEPKGAKAARRAATLRRLTRRERARKTPEDEQEGQELDTAFAELEPQPNALDEAFSSPELLNRNVPGPEPNMMSSSSVLVKEATVPYRLEDVVGCTNTLPEEPLFYDSPDTGATSGYELSGASPESCFLAQAE